MNLDESRYPEHRNSESLGLLIIIRPNIGYTMFDADGDRELNILQVRMLGMNCCVTSMASAKPGSLVKCFHKLLLS